MTPRARQPKGVPVGGQFAATAHSEPSVTLAALPGSCLMHGDVVSESVDEDGAERVVTAMTSTPEFDAQLRSHLGITDASAEVQVHYEVVYFEEEEGQVYVAECAGKKVTAHSRDRLLEQISGPGPHAEPEIDPGAQRSRLVLPKDPFLGRHARCPEPRTAEWVFGRDECIDAAVGTVLDGPLSRGVVNSQRRIAFHAWHDWAEARARETGDPAYQDFLMGLRTGVASLYEGRMDHYKPGLDRFKQGGTPVYAADHAIQISGNKRTSREDREHWRKLLKHAPTEEWHRGHLAAAIILSGADGYWGLRDNPDAAVTVPIHSPE